VILLLLTVILFVSLTDPNALNIYQLYEDVTTLEDGPHLARSTKTGIHSLSIGATTVSAAAISLQQSYPDSALTVTEVGNDDCGLQIETNTECGTDVNNYLLHTFYKTSGYNAEGLLNRVLK
jgi:hypothetical protein